MKKYVQLSFDFKPWDDEEVWKNVIEEGFEEVYQTSNKNRIRSVDRWVDGKNGNKRFVKGRILKPSLGRDRGGYPHVILSNNGVKKTCSAHKLIFEAFNGKVPEGYEINHIDENKQNNILSNLNLLTHEANMRWGTHNERVAKANTNNKLRSKSVIQKYLDGKVIKIWPSLHEIERELGYNNSHIAECCRGGFYRKGKWINITQAYGYLWQYEEKATA